MKSKQTRKLPPDDKPQTRPGTRGETVEQYLARGGTVKKVELGIADGAIPFNRKYPGGRP